MNQKDRNNKYKKVFNTPDGEKVVEDLKKQFHFEATTYTDGLDTNTAIYREGRRSVVLWILNQIKDKENKE